MRRTVTEYADVALEALVLRDSQALRDFVHREIGPLNGTDQRSTVLRETLRAYFATGQNGASTAHVLGIHERTVAYRLRSIEERLGTTVQKRRDELSAALRFRALLQVEPVWAGSSTTATSNATRSEGPDDE